MPRHLASLLALLPAAACTWTPAPAHPRPALPARAIPETAAPLPAATPRSVATEGGVTRGELVAGDETVRFRVLRCTEGGGPRPVVLLLPILAGGDDLLESVARRLCDHGFDVAHCARVGAALRPEQRAPELDDLFRRTVLHQRLLLAWLRGADQPPPGVFVLGMSMGGMVATVLTALEPTIDGAAMCLAGGDLAGMIACSTEIRVQRWTEWRRRTDGVGSDHVQWELQQFLRYEPLPFAAAVPTDKVLLVGAAFDSVVPPRHQDLLWEALGRPARLQVPLGHYSAALAIDPILAAVAAHFTARLPAATAARPAR